MLNTYTITKIDKRIFTLFVILFPIAFTLTGSDDGEQITFSEWLTIMWIVFSSAVLVYTIYFVIFKKYLPEKQVLFIILSTIGLLTTTCIIDLILNYIFLRHQPDYKAASIEEFFNLVVLHLLFSGVLFSILLIKKSNESQILILKAENAQKSTELKALNAQVDPHFLFNNLNTLDALLDTNVSKAKTYIQHLSKLYQYLLKNKDEETITIKDELNYANNYCYLIQERFGNSYQFNFHYDNDYDSNKLLPPNALQTVFENIVKHNTASSKKPVNINIYIRKNTIEVVNTIAIKKYQTPSYSIGLNNLKARYKLLSNKNIHVAISNCYSITLPLLDNLNP